MALLRTTAVAAMAVAVGSLSAGLAVAQDPAPDPAPQEVPAEQRIGPNVAAGGVDLSNLLVSEAAAKLRAELTPRLLKNVSVRVAGRRFTLAPARASVSFDPDAVAAQAYTASRDRPPPAEGAVPAPLSIPLGVTFSESAVRELARDVSRGIRLRPRNATLRITVRHMVKRRARAGRDVHQRNLVESVSAVLADPQLGRIVRPKLRRSPAAINVNDLARRYPTVVTVDRNTFTLRLFKRLRISKRYRIALGAAGFDTPRGLFSVRSRAVNPAWHAPNKPWAGEYAGKTVPGGDPRNPLKARWLGLADGVGIHGTAEEWSIGTRASHGCIRMRVREVIDLFPRVPLGTPVLVR